MSELLYEIIELLPTNKKTFRNMAQLYQQHREQHLLTLLADCQHARCAELEEVTCVHCIIARYAVALKQVCPAGPCYYADIGEVLQAYLLRYSPEDLTMELL